METRLAVLVLALTIAIPAGNTISITHYDKPTRPSTALRDTQPDPSSNVTLAPNERHRRLIPYMTYYITPNRVPQQIRILPQKLNLPQQNKYIVTNFQPKYSKPPPPVYSKLTYTPFVDANKVPGHFAPMTGQPIRVREPDYSLIFDKLLELKQNEYNKPYYPQANQNKPQYYNRNYATRPPIKIIVEQIPQRYKPIANQYRPQELYEIQPKPDRYVVQNYKTIAVPVKQDFFKPVQEAPFVPVTYKPIEAEQIKPSVEQQREYQPEYDRNPEPVKPRVQTSVEVIRAVYEPDIKDDFKPSVELVRPAYPTKPVPTPFKAPAMKTIVHTYTPTDIEINNEHNIQDYNNFESLKTHHQIQSPVQQYRTVTPKPDDYYRTVTPKPEDYHQTEQAQPIYQPSSPDYAQQTEATTRVDAQTDNPNSLSVILKQLQDSNTLPQTLTPDNIDNSIKTLVHILNNLKRTQKFQRPIIVADDASEDESDSREDILPQTITQNFPGNTEEGGTPGKPGVDYPALSAIPQTRFDCKEQRYKGFFGDPDTNCQVWHYCDLNGGQASFLCPNGTIFSQVALTCDWWYNVKCTTTTQLYVLNERLYKYILPFNPKFPEDYSGPLVDRYLALKFQEMEEKMKKQKKGKTDKNPDDTHDSDVDKLQVIERDAEQSPDTKKSK